MLTNFTIFTISWAPGWLTAFVNILRTTSLQSATTSCISICIFTVVLYLYLHLYSYLASRLVGAVVNISCHNFSLKLTAFDVSSPNCGLDLYRIIYDLPILQEILFGKTFLHNVDSSLHSTATTSCHQRETTVGHRQLAEERKDSQEVDIVY